MRMHTCSSVALLFPLEKSVHECSAAQRRKNDVVAHSKFGGGSEVLSFGACFSDPPVLLLSLVEMV